MGCVIPAGEPESTVWIPVCTGMTLGRVTSDEARETDLIPRPSGENCAGLGTFLDVLFNCVEAGEEERARVSGDEVPRVSRFKLSVPRGELDSLLIKLEVSSVIPAEEPESTVWIPVCTGMALDRATGDTLHILRVRLRRGRRATNW